MLKRPNKKEIAWKAEFHNAKKKENDLKENTVAITAVIATVAAVAAAQLLMLLPLESAKEQHIAKRKKN